MNKIFTFWHQGFQNASPIIRICHEGLKRNVSCEAHELITLEAKNLFSYIDLPGYIMDKHAMGKITHTHLSDIIRSVLLKEYGGLWVDASVLVTRPLIGSDIFDRDFFTLKNPRALPGDITSRWECFFIAGQKDFPLFSFLVDFWFAYWKKENDLITYLLIDHIFDIAYNENLRVRKAIDACPSFHYPIGWFQKKLNMPYDEKIYKEAFQNEICLKLTYKMPLHENTVDGTKTFYGRLVADYLTGKR